MTYKPPEYRFLVDVNLPKFFNFFQNNREKILEHIKDTSFVMVHKIYIRTVG